MKCKLSSIKYSLFYKKLLQANIVIGKLALDMFSSNAPP